MESQKIKISLIQITCLLLMVMIRSCPLYAQKIWEERKGCISVQGNLAPGYLFAQKSVSAYFDGDVELFLDDRASFIGEAFISFATTEKTKAGLRANHAIFWGANYHFLKPGRFDPYVGFTPGMGLVRAGYKSGEDIKLTPFSVAPLLGLSVGCNYYVGSIFHFFVKVQGVTGQMFSTLPGPKRLDELKFMAGLGWNLRMWKPKKHDTWKKASG
ncbi:MAG: hypothetical protein JWO03_1857 [Bacteroidetes bacterium]|nr:hypothetical protein [Bacteroidota bacterium]